MSTCEIGIRVGVAASTVRLTLRRVAAAGMVDGISAEQTDATLEKLLFTGSCKKTGHRRCADPDWAAIHQELKRKHVTLTIVWDEYDAREPDDSRYSRFCKLYRGWEARLAAHPGGVPQPAPLARLIPPTSCLQGSSPRSRSAATVAVDLSPVTGSQPLVR